MQNVDVIDQQKVTSVEGIIDDHEDKEDFDDWWPNNKIIN